MNIVVLVNPTSGRGRGAAAAEAAARRLRARGVEPRVLTGGSAGEMRRLAVEAVRDRPDALAVVGGDGTLSLIIDDVLGSGVPVLLVPAGTGNDLARGLGLPHGSPEHAAAAIDAALDGAARLVDVGEAECGERRMRFLTIGAIGLDARVAERTNRLRWPRGPLRYYLALAIELARLTAIPFEVGVDGGPPRRMPGILIAVGNTRSYGGGIPMCPDAELDDGRFDVTHVAPIGLPHLLRIFPLLLQSRHSERAEATLLRAATVEVSGPGLVVYADGERVGEGSVRFRMRPERLPVLAPAPPA